MKVINLKKSIFLGNGDLFRVNGDLFRGNGDLLLETETFCWKRRPFRKKKRLIKIIKKKKKKFLGCLKNSEEISMRSMK